MERHIILRIITKALVPPIMLFALYVQFHGDYGPGGGFQAGVIFGSAFILYGLLFGVMQVQQVVSPRRVRQLAASGVLIYAGVGVAGLLLGGNFLDYFVLDHDPVHGQHRGIFWVEVGVAVTVSGVMLKIFYMFADRGHVDDLDDEDPGRAR
jgi:multicomponent Na+:H+ antiporter subunit B